MTGDFMPIMREKRVFGRAGYLYYDQAPSDSSGCIPISTYAPIKVPGVRPADRPAWDWLLLLARAAALLALAVCLYLAWAALQGGKVAGCGETGLVNCDSVLQSEWSRWFSIPISIPAAGVYTCLLITLLMVGDS